MKLFDLRGFGSQDTALFAEIDGDRMTISCGFIDEDLPPAERRRRRVIGTLRIDE